MRFTNVAVFGVALSAVFLQGCIGLVGMAAMSAAGPRNAAPADGAQPAAATSGGQAQNPGARGVAMKVVKAGAMGAVGGPVGYGIVSQSPKLARAMLGRRAAKPANPAAETKATTESAAGNTALGN
jgi:hypothetical protein